MKSKEYIINEYITVRLEGVRTVIYIKEKEFRRCKYLLLNLTPQNITDIDQVNSIDDIKGLDHSLGESERDRIINIPPETEFWGHCSNLQVWAENDYDLKLIYSDLGRDLIKELTEVGDPLAKAKFKEEIVKKFSNYEVFYMYISIKDKELDFFEDEALKMLLDKLRENNIKCFWFLLPFFVKAGYVQLNREELEDLVVNSYRRIHSGVFNEIDLSGIIQEFYNTILEFEKELDEKA